MAGRVVVIALDDLEEILGRRILVGENEGAQAASPRGAVIEAGGDVARTALLAALEDKRAHLAGCGALRLDALMNVALRPVEHERHDRAALAADAQMLAREIFEVGLKTCLRRPALHLFEMALQSLQRWQIELL